MAKKPKDKWLGARVDADLEAQVTTYINAAEELNMGILVRRAVAEFMLNHPIKGMAPSSINALAGKE